MDVDDTFELGTSLPRVIPQVEFVELNVEFMVDFVAGAQYDPFSFIVRSKAGADGIRIRVPVFE